MASGVAAPCGLAVVSVRPPHYAVRVFWIERIVGLTGCDDERDLPFLDGADGVDRAVRAFLRLHYVYRVEWAEAVFSRARLERHSASVLLEHTPLPGSAAACWGWAFDGAEERAAVDLTLGAPWESLLRHAKERVFNSAAMVCAIPAFDGAAWRAERGWGFTVPRSVRAFVERSLSARHSECAAVARAHAEETATTPPEPQAAVAPRAALEIGAMQCVVQLGDGDAREWLPVDEALRRLRAAEAKANQARLRADHF